MDELVVAQVDADVGERAAHRVEEHEIAGLEFVDLDLFAHLGHFGSRAGHAETKGVGEYLADKAAAVETGERAGAAKPVGHTQEIQAAVDKRADRIGVALEDGSRLCFVSGNEWGLRRKDRIGKRDRY